ncbi:MAG: hypothetical protein IPP71_10925 [Bacteroidetes bacterium]|nr:hypothetical protein [Bacteroidota bacterium]
MAWPPPTYATFEVFRTDALILMRLGLYLVFENVDRAQFNEVEHLAIFNSHSWSIIPSPFNDINFRATSGNMFL